MKFSRVSSKTFIGLFILKGTCIDFRSFIKLHFNSFIKLIIVTLIQPQHSLNQQTVDYPLYFDPNGVFSGGVANWPIFYWFVCWLFICFWFPTWPTGGVLTGDHVTTTDPDPHDVFWGVFKRILCVPTVSVTDRDDLIFT